MISSATATAGLVARKAFATPRGALGSIFSPLLQFKPPLSQPCEGIGPARYRSNRSRRGLYDGKDIRSGNNVSFSMKATKRKFKPNVFIKRVYSETLDEMVRFHLTTSALRTIDKMGGLDNYLLKSKHVTEGEGLAARKRILTKRWEMEQEKKEKDQEMKSEETAP